MADSAGIRPAPSAIELSPAGRERRAEILGELLGAVERVHRRRRQRCRIAAAAHLAAIAVVVAMLRPTMGPEPAARPEAVSAASSAAEGSAAAASSRVAFVETDPGVLDRYRPAGTLRTVMMMDDQRLLGALAAIDRPTGLVRQGGRVWLTADVLGP